MAKAGSIRIPSSLCGVVGLKTTYGWTDMRGSICDCGTVEILGPIASTVEDVMLVYAAILGSSPADRISLKPWFNDINSTDISDKCEDVLDLLCKTHGCEMVEIVIPELHEMLNAHVVSIGAEMLCFVNPDCDDGQVIQQIEMHGKREAWGSFTLNAKRVSTRVQKTLNQPLLLEMMYYRSFSVD